VHARILKFYDQIGLARDVVDGGLKLEAVRLWGAGREKGRVVFGDMGKGISPFPYVLIFPQDEHERLLIDRLKVLGVAVERGTELVGFDHAGMQVTARLKRPDGSEETVETAYLAATTVRIRSHATRWKSGFPAAPTRTCSMLPMSRQPVRP
jgi:2-polyprenyl-6-methoxyphenol hydroxylase-like FAD-dependent oxidoreductase